MVTATFDVKPVIGVYTHVPFTHDAVEHSVDTHLGKVIHCPVAGLQVEDMHGSNGCVQFTKYTKSLHVT